MDISPFQNGSQCTLGELSFHNPSLDFYGNLIITVFRVKMSWRMITIEHANHNSQETADFRHWIAVSNKKLSCVS